VRDRFGALPGEPSQEELLPLAGSFEAGSLSTEVVRGYYNVRATYSRQYQ